MTLILDILAFGILLAATLVDRVPEWQGFPLVVVVCGFAYLCTRELTHLLVPRRLESAESFATTLAVLIIGFVYFFRRNDSDFILLLITLALMMASLMLVIALMGCLSDRRLTPFLQLGSIIGVTAVLGGLFAHVILLPMVVPDLAIPAAAIVASYIWWRFAGAKVERDATVVERRPVLRAQTVVAFVSTFIIGCVGAAVAGGSFGKLRLLETGGVGWLTALAGIMGFSIWESLRPAIVAKSGDLPCVIPFLKGRLLDRLVPLMFIATVLYYYFWTPRN